MRTILLMAAAAGAAYVLGARSADPHARARRYSPYQRLALVWTSPRAVRTRRALKRRTRGLRG